MEKKNYNLFVIISVCLAIAVVVLALALFLRGCGNQSNESSAEASVNTEISETVSDISTDEVSAEVSEDVSVPEISTPDAHTHEYSEKWSSNETDHWYECECGDKTNIANHTFGEWETTKEATETETGSKKHTCSVCGYEESATIPMLSHTHEYSNEWSSNETDHWKECKCGDKSNVTSHNYGDWIVTKEATEEAEGSKSHTCSACGYKETVKIPVLSHTHKYGDWKNNATSHWKECECGDKSQLSSHTYGDWVTTKDATCTETGTKKHTCTACGYSDTETIPVLDHTYVGWKNSADSHWKECACSNITDKGNHTYGEWETVTEATCATIGTKKRICTICGYCETVTIPKADHNYGDWKNDATYHWRECSCGEKANYSTHSFGDWVVTKEATETSEGSQYRACSMCDYTETETIAKLPHTHVYSDWKSNASSHWKECNCRETVNFASHSFGSWTISKEATETSEGSKYRACTACGYKETGTIPTKLKIVTQPQSVGILTGTYSHSMSVNCSGGSGYYNYEWQKKDGNNWKRIGSGQKYTLWEDDLTRGVYSYRCIISDGYSSVTSDICTLTIFNAPKITCSKNIKGSSWSTVKITVTITTDTLDPNRYTYQWWLQDGYHEDLGSHGSRLVTNSSDVSGATTTTLTIKTGGSRISYYSFRMIPSSGGFYSEVNNIKVTIS